ncbi:hypothetical protein C7M71_003270 [Peterkaempfera bronchialis]|uniref:Uncharacterized protein n=1 Tax=Peterkaempfera bronchialis TaxID=2126346 RepID=A0A345SSC7_9ACTN|nr:hypothetical protein C7M71_003270 [Peterkaempfera bronchialis]
MDLGWSPTDDAACERREVADVQTTMVYEHVRSRRIEPISPDRPRPAPRLTQSPVTAEPGDSRAR